MDASHCVNCLCIKIVELSERFPSIAKPFILGTSVRGQPLVGLRLSSNVRQGRKLLKVTTSQ